MKTPEQLEMGICDRQSRAANRRQRKLQRAHWWFNRMRTEVSNAREWEPNLKTYPETPRFVFQGYEI